MHDMSQRVEAPRTVWVTFERSRHPELDKTTHVLRFVVVLH
jgi:hypothetical protein